MAVLKSGFPCQYARRTIGLVWRKLELEIDLLSYKRPWNITFFGNVESCEPSVLSPIIHEYHKLLSAFLLL